MMGIEHMAKVATAVVVEPIPPRIPPRDGEIISSDGYAVVQVRYMTREEFHRRYG